jgi:hypothetical protein
MIKLNRQKKYIFAEIENRKKQFLINGVLNLKSNLLHIKYLLKILTFNLFFSCSLCFQNELKKVVFKKKSLEMKINIFLFLFNKKMRNSIQ